MYVSTARPLLLRVVTRQRATRHAATGTCSESEIDVRLKLAAPSPRRLTGRHPASRRQSGQTNRLAQETASNGIQAIVAASAGAGAPLPHLLDEAAAEHTFMDGEPSRSEHGIERLENA